MNDFHEEVDVIIESYVSEFGTALVAGAMGGIMAYDAYKKGKLPGMKKKKKGKKSKTK